MRNEPAADDSTGAAAAATETSASGGDELTSLKAALAAAEEATRAQRDQYLRAMAEIENVRKRSQRDIENAHRYAVEGFAGELLPVLDSLELGVRNGVNADAQTLLDGQQAMLKLMEKAFAKHAIRRLDPAGEPFDPSLHEAVMMQPSDRAEPGSVLQVVQSGYELNGRLLRPARVIVARSPDGA